jgi:nitroreductase
MTNPTIDHLLTRRSVSANSLGEPGPSQDEIVQILMAAARVPDHKKLVPWRFLLFQGEARKEFGKVLAEICEREEKDPSQFRLETEANRFTRAPLVIAVISRVVNNPAAPEWEQVLSAGAACQNLLIAATALGYGAQWITEWYGYSQACAPRSSLPTMSGWRASSISAPPGKSPKSVSGRRSPTLPKPGGGNDRPQ